MIRAKYDQEFVKRKLKKYGYKLLNEYINVKTQLILQDEEGYLYVTTWDSFNQGRKPRMVHLSNPYSLQNIKLYTSKLGYTLLSTEYINAHTKLILQDEEDYLYMATWNNFSKWKNSDKFHKSNPYTIQNIKLWMKINAVGHELLSTEFKSAISDLKFKCPEGHKFEVNWNSFQQGYRCPYCSNHKVLKGYNDIATTTPWMIDLGMSREDAETHTKGSNDKVEVTCPNCGREKCVIISDMYNRKTISCMCGDGISYSEKFIIFMLDQLNINYIREYCPKWDSSNKRYDFYLKDCNCIVECHGKQHYNCDFSYYGGRTLQEEQENDRYKKQLALENGIDYYIELDCRESDLEYIKNSILNSELNNLFNLSKIDWLECEKFTINSNKVKEVSNYWHLHNEINNENLTTGDIGKVFNLSYNTINKYLKQGVKLGWCNYDAKKSHKNASGKGGKVLGKQVEIFKYGKSLGIFESCHELERQSEKLFGVKLLNGMVSKVCRGKLKQYKGFTFKYISKEEYEERK